MRRMPILASVLLLTACGASGERIADTAERTPAHVERVVLEESGGAWDVGVTVRHEDSGWDHYADRWVIVDGEGRELARRVLRHPHVDEQPFTRSLEGVRLPPGLKRFEVRAHCSAHGDGGRAVTVDIGRDQGPGYEVRRSGTEAPR